VTGGVVSLGDLSGFPMAPEGGSETFGATVAPVGKAVGLSKLGAMLTTVEPGKRAFPFHAHHANDEMFVILEGSGEVRIGETTHAIKAGDVVGCPAGTAEGAHQIVNTGDAPLRYLGVSTMIDPEVVEYPDSGKLAVMSIGPGNDFMSARVRHVFRREDGRDYWEGEA
jgi:uncharacterized cupin superfamily protein